MLVIAITLFILLVSIFFYFKEGKIYFLKYKNIIYSFWVSLFIVSINFFLKDFQSIETFVLTINEMSFMNFIITFIAIELIDFWKNKYKV
jgi:hypothetical protein